MQFFELLAYIGVVVTLFGRFGSDRFSLVSVKWLYLVGAVALGVASYLSNNPIFTGLEIVIISASASAFIPKKYLSDIRRGTICAAAGLIALIFSSWMIQQGAPWYWWNWFGVIGILFVIPGFSFVGNAKVSELCFIGSCSFLVISSLLDFQLGFSHLSLAYLVMNALFGIKTLQAYYKL